MIDDLMTFGECLSSLIKNKNVSVTRLAELTGMKSRNSIQRILKDESSISVIEAFKERVINLDELGLQKSETLRLEESIEISRVGKDAYRARNILLPVFNRKLKPKSAIPSGFSPGDQAFIRLNELFETYKSFASIRILISDLVSIPFADELVNLTRTSSPGMITISHIMYLGSSRSHNAAAFASAFELFNHQQYSLYGITLDSSSGTTPSLPSNFVIIDKQDSEGHHFTDLIKMETNDTFTYIADIPGNSLFAYYQYQFDQIRSGLPNIRRVYDMGNPINTVIDISKQSLPLNYQPRYMIRNNFFTRMIPIDFIKNLCADANFFGMEEDDPLLTNAFQLLSFRYTSYYNDTLKVNFFTKRGLLDFVNNGMFTDHFCYLRPFNKDEIRAILGFILDKLENNHNFKILLVKDDHAIGNLEFSYIENDSLWVYDSYSGYSDDYYEFYINCPEILEICDDCIKNELLPKHTLPETETIAYLKYLLSLV